MISHLLEVSCVCVSGSKSTLISHLLEVSCVCVVGGKTFGVCSAENEEVAVQLAAQKAADHFGYQHPQLRMDLRKHLRIYRYEITVPSHSSMKARMTMLF